MLKNSPQSQKCAAEQLSNRVDWKFVNRVDWEYINRIGWRLDSS